MLPALGVLARIGMILAPIALILGGLEVVLRLHPTLLGETFATGALSKYTSRAGGIYYRDPKLRIFFMTPNHRTTMYANGYVWHHETDALGFRNKVLHVPADVVLLGDSVGYGHGVEWDHTIGAYLEQLAGVRVANLARQGDCAYQEAYLLTQYISLFQPRYVLHLFSSNDITDASTVLSVAAMEEFIATPFDAIRFPQGMDPAVAMARRERLIRERPWWKIVREQSYVRKMFKWLAFEVQRRWEWWPRLMGSLSPAIVEAAGQVLLVDDDPNALGWRYTKKAILYMDHISRRAGAQFVIVPTAASPHQFEILKAFAAEHRLGFVNTWPTLGAIGMWLQADGHLAPAGAHKLADLTADYIRRASARPIALSPSAGQPGVIERQAVKRRDLRKKP